VDAVTTIYDFLLTQLFLVRREEVDKVCLGVVALEELLEVSGG
jgi:hypothetical protein